MYQMLISLKKVIIVGLAVFLAVRGTSVLAQDLSRLGGDLTSDMPLSTALELPPPNIRSSDMFFFHLLGHADFHGSFALVKKEGKPVLGPVFNHTACGNCHIKNGRGVIGFSQTSEGTAMLVKVALRGLNADGSPRKVPRVGEQLRDRKFGGKAQYNIRLAWQEVNGQYPDGTPYTLRRPRINFTIPKVNSKDIVTSIRMTPPTIGMGLLEAVSEQAINQMSDPFDADKDGISGKPNFVPDKIKGEIAIGRFGFRASHPTVKQQSAAAFFNDMGMTNEIFPGGKKTPPEVDAETMDRLVFYQAVAGVTPARNQDDPDVQKGKALFQQINCHGCHKLSLQTGPTDIVELQNQTFHPFTDLLLHDMGQGLADKRPEFSANGREWRTTPLWGLGLVKELLPNGQSGFLHDGRARTIEEAILWHGGEAAKSRNAFKALTGDQRRQLILFLQSL